MPESSTKVTNSPSALEWKFGTAEQIPSDKRRDWKPFRDPLIKRDVDIAMKHVKQWLTNKRWLPHARAACIEWNEAQGRINNQSVNTKLFASYNPRLAEELVNNALVFQTIQASGEATELGVKPYKIAVYGSTFRSNSRWTYKLIPIPVSMGFSITHELMHHYTRWMHVDEVPRLNPLDPIYAITSAILSVNGHPDFRYTEGSW